VINYNGGDNYAIRRVHPNLKDTEGMYLSTNMTDIEGNQPYLTELEGVKQDGELFFNYFFKKNNTDVVSEKITYAKLYPEYDWIIAMGVHLDDVKAIVDQSTAMNERNINYIMMAVAALFVLIAIALSFVSILEKWYFRIPLKIE
jgi:signal transduction histidine kinase